MPTIARVFAKILKIESVCSFACLNKTVFPPHHLAYIYYKQNNLFSKKNINKTCYIRNHMLENKL